MCGVCSPKCLSVNIAKNPSTGHPRYKFTFGRIPRNDRSLVWNVQNRSRRTVHWQCISKPTIGENQVRIVCPSEKEIINCLLSCSFFSPAAIDSTTFSHKRREYYPGGTKHYVWDNWRCRGRWCQIHTIFDRVCEFRWKKGASVKESMCVHIRLWIFVKT